MKKGKIEQTYLNRREEVIAEIRRMNEAQHKDERDIYASVLRLVDHMAAQPLILSNMVFIDGLAGYLKWCKQHEKPEVHVLHTIIHDLGEYKRHKDEAWFSPRTSPFEKFADAKEGEILLP